MDGGNVAAAFAVATMFMRNQVRPIRRLAAAVDDFGKGRGGPGLPPRGATEIRRAAAAFERMRSRIQNALNAADRDARRRVSRPADAADAHEAQGCDAGRYEGSERAEGRPARDGVMVEEFLRVRPRRGTEEAIDADVGDIIDGIAESVATERPDPRHQTVGDLVIPCASTPCGAA